MAARWPRRSRMTSSWPRRNSAFSKLPPTELQSIHDIYRLCGTRRPHHLRSPFGGGAPRNANAAELAEIRHAILAEIERKSYRSGGRNLFPYNRVSIRIRGADAQQAGALEGDFLREYFENEIRQALGKAEAQHPADLRVAVEVSNDHPAKGEKRLSVETRFEEPPPQPKPKDLVGRLSVVQGTAAESRGSGG